MPKKTPAPEPQIVPERGIVVQSITGEMETAYLDYAMSVITMRALPDVRDGLKPVHRRILYSMRLNGLTSTAKFKKSATVVGDVLGNFHPHGDLAVYESMVKLVQPFSTRYPLVIGQGNFGSIDGDNAAAYRYTEAKMSKVAEELLRDLEKDTVDWRPNFDGTKKEPIVLPAAAPNLLLLGSLGIAVGMATNIPPHNLREVAAAVAHLIDNPEASTDDLLKFVKGPDFPTGAIAFNQKDIAHAYANGRGGVTVRGEAEIVEDKKGAFAIIITSIPYRVNKADMQEKIADLVREKKIEDELKEIQQLIKELEAILKSKAKMMGIVKDDLLEVAEKFGDERRTKIVKGGVKQLNPEDLVPDDESVLVLTAGGYVKRTNPEEYKVQKRGGVGVIDLNTKEEDVVTTLLTTSAHSDLLFFTNTGKVYKSKMYEIPEGKKATRGKSIMNFLPLGSEEKVTSVLAVKKDEWDGDWGLMMFTQNGVAKKSDAASFKDVRRSGLIAITLKDDDSLISARFVGKGDELSLVTRGGQSIRFKEADVREMGRTASGVTAMKLGKNDEIVSAEVIASGAKDREILIVTEDGYGKATPAKEYKVQNRGGSGIKTVKVTDKTGKVVCGIVISPEERAEGELVIMSKKGQVIKLPLKDVPVLGRDTQGVRVMKMRAGDSIASVVFV